MAGVAGFPVSHSRSPAMMATALAQLGLDWRYVRLPLAPARFADTVRALPASGYVGINVTVPHKLAALELADSAGAAARAIGAANILTFSDGTIAADNTDAGGFLAALGEDPSGRDALVLGAGGAGRAVVWALREAGARVSVWNRTPRRAAALAEELGVAHAREPHRADILVNATSVGLDPSTEEPAAVAALGLDRVEAPAVFADLVYGERATALERWAGAAGARTVSGLETLVRQGALSLQRWTGREGPVDAMRGALHPGAAAREEIQG